MQEIKANRRTPIKSIEERETEQMAIAAAENISLATHARLEKSQIAYLLTLIAEGLSNKAIIRRFDRRYDRKITIGTIRRYKERYVSKLSKYAQDMDFATLNESYARRAVRINRLTAISEAMEEAIINEDGSLADNANAKIIKEYREALRQIAQEVGDMPIDGPDMTFINMSDDELKKYVAGKLKANKDLSVILAEEAGVRPTVQLIDTGGDVIGQDDGDGTGYKPRPPRA